jgi:hypothetical protein
MTTSKERRGAVAAIHVGERGWSAKFLDGNGIAQGDYDQPRIIGGTQRHQHLVPHPDLATETRNR